MTNINLLIKRKQYLWVVVILCVMVLMWTTGWFLSRLSTSKETTEHQQPAPDLTGVVDTTFDEKVTQHAITQTQAAHIDMLRRFKDLEQKIDQLKKRQNDDQQQLATLRKENNRLSQQIHSTEPRKEEIKKTEMTLHEPLNVPEGEPAPDSFPPLIGHRQVAPPSAFYAGVGQPSPSQQYTESIPLPGELVRHTFTVPTLPLKKRYPYIPSGSFVESMLIEGADANASVTGNQATVPMQVRLTGKVEMQTVKLMTSQAASSAWKPMAMFPRARDYPHPKNQLYEG